MEREVKTIEFSLHSKGISSAQKPFFIALKTGEVSKSGTVTIRGASPIARKPAAPAWKAFGHVSLTGFEIPDIMSYALPVTVIRFS